MREADRRIVKYPAQIASAVLVRGSITAGVILAEAVMLDGLNVVQTQTYGPEARSGLKLRRGDHF